MLWINERMITEYDGSRHKEYDIHITRGDSGYLELLPEENGEAYSLGADDVLTLQVRKKPIKSDVETELLFVGELITDETNPIWHITTANTTRDCGVYFWDVQIETGEDVYTFAAGRFVIEEEKTR